MVSGGVATDLAARPPSLVNRGPGARRSTARVSPVLRFEQSRPVSAPRQARAKRTAGSASGQGLVARSRQRGQPDEQEEGAERLFVLTAHTQQLVDNRRYAEAAALGDEASDLAARLGLSAAQHEIRTVMSRVIVSA